MLVAAPTGAGKTIVGEFAIHLAMREPRATRRSTRRRSRRCQNQKFRELPDVYGADEVGLLTGDTNINGNARIVVMTTEVLRNMLYADSAAAARTCEYVVMDEVHYLADRFRGAVWEEIIIHLPQRGAAGLAERDGVQRRGVRRLARHRARRHRGDRLGGPARAARAARARARRSARPVRLGRASHAQVNQELMRIRRQAPSSRGSARAGDAAAQLGDSIAGRTRRPRPARRGERAAHRAPRPAGVVRAARAREPAAGDLLHLQPRRLRRRGAAGAARRRAAHRAGGARRDPRDRRGAHAAPCSTRTSPCSATGSGSTTSSAASPRTTPGCCPAFKEVVEELFQRKLREGRVRDRDARARHQHARPHRRAREAREVQRRGARADHVGGVHPAHRPRRAPRHRRRGARRHPVDRRARPAGGRGARLAAHAIRSTRASGPTYNMAVNLIDQFGRDAHARDPRVARSRSSRPTAPSSASPARCASRRSRSPATRRR